MSWSGPVAGTTPYQPPPYASGQPAFGQPQTFHYGQQPNYNQHQHGPTLPQPGPPRPLDTRPPKKKGNPIITRYPPPPGYRGPAHPQGPYGTAQYPAPYQQPQQSYSQGAPVPPAYPNSGYQTPSSTPGYPAQTYATSQSHPQPPYPHSNYSQAPSYQWPQQPQPSYFQQPGIPQPSNYPGTQGYSLPQNNHQSYSPQAAAVSVSQHAWTQAQGWQQPSASATYLPTHQQNHTSDASMNVHAGPDLNATPVPTSGLPAMSQPILTSSQPQNATSEHGSGEKAPLYLAWDDWDFDFDGAIWPKANEPVDPNLSLGVIIWRPAKQVTRALPSTFSDAEEQALKPPADNLGNGESVSIYFTAENSHEAFLDVRQTDEWYKIHKDPIFVTFSEEEMKQSLIPIEDCISLRDRLDEPLDELEEDEDEEMRDAAWNVMDNLEQALSATAKDTDQISRRDACSLRQQTQEDILAKLGVTGLPKPPSSEHVSFPFPLDKKPVLALPTKPLAPPLAHILPHPEQPAQRAQPLDVHRNATYSQPIARPYGSVSSAPSSQSDQPPQQPCGPWNPKPSVSHPQFNSQALDISRASPTHSECSHRTPAGSDFELEQTLNGLSRAPTPPIPQLKRSDSSITRKRSYEDADQEDENVRQQDDNTRRKRRSQVAAAYSRR